jgi:hypothetical protein
MDWEKREPNAPDYWRAPILSNKAYCLLWLERWGEALEVERRAHSMRQQTGLTSTSHLIASALWLMGLREEAVSEWRSNVEGLMSGRINYTDPSGGGIDSLRLYFGAVMTENVAEISRSKRLMKKMTTRRQAIVWPRVLLDRILGKATDADLYSTCFGHANPSDAVAGIDADDVLKKMQLCQATFYGATHCKEQQLEEGRANFLRLCSDPRIEVKGFPPEERFLAHAESRGL